MSLIPLFGGMDTKEKLDKIRKLKCDKQQLEKLKADPVVAGAGQGTASAKDCAAFDAALTKEIKSRGETLQKWSTEFQGSLSAAAPKVLGAESAAKECAAQGRSAFDCATALFSACRPILDEIRRMQDVPGAPSGALGSASGLSWQTALFTGLTDFLLERASQELGLWLLQTMQAKICATPEWFPQACKILNPNDSSGKIVEQVPATLFASAIRADLDHFPLVAVAALTKDEVALEMLRATKALIVNCAKTKKCGEAELKQLAQTLADKTHILGLGVAIGQAAQHLIPPFKPNDTCEALVKLVATRSFREAINHASGGEATGWTALFQEKPACTDSGPKDTGTDNKATPMFAALFTLVKDGNALLADFQKQASKPDPDLIVARVHDDLVLLIDLVRQGAILDGRDAAKKVSSNLRIAVGAIDVLEGLYDVFTQLRRGASPLELLAGFASLARKSDLPKLLCTDEDTKSKLGCTLVAVGTLVAETGDVLDMLKPGPDGKAPGWDEAQACQKIKNIVEDDNFWTSLHGLYETLPAPLAALEKLKKDAIDCTSWPPGGAASDALIQLRRLLRAAFDLESQLRQAAQAQDKTSTRERVAQMLSLMINVVEAAANIVGQEKSADIVRLVSICQALGDMFQGNYADGIRATLVLLSNEAAVLPESVRRYLPLISDLASATDAKSVQAALQAAAAPLGSWRSKQRRPMIAVTSVVGGSVAWEHALGPTNVTLSDGWGAGATASLGVEFSADWYNMCRALRGDSCGMSPPTKANGSLGLYVTVIDLGQLAVARVTGLADTSTSMNPPNQQTNVQRQSNVSWEDVFSPGLYLKLNVPRTPLTLGGGASYAPQLRKYSFTDPDAKVISDFLSTIRVGFFLGVDLTLFPLK